MCPCEEEEEQTTDVLIFQCNKLRILVYGAEVWQISTREVNKILSTEMDVLRRSARKSRMERIKNEGIKEIIKEVLSAQYV